MDDTFNRECIEGLGYATPYFRISKPKIVSALAEFNQSFPGAGIYYAMKANSEPEVLKAVFEAGGGFEVASAQELLLLKDIKVPAGRIIYGSSIKPASHIKAFFEYGVDRFAFDSLSELEKIAAIAPSARVYVRVNVDDAGSVFQFSEKFGADKENVLPLLQHARRLGLKPHGISFHVGSQACNPLAWANAVESLLPYVEQLCAIGIDIEMINLGGGYPCAYASSKNHISLRDIACHTRAALAKLPVRPVLVLEPGRGIIADAAIMVSSVIARVERRGRAWLFLDAGVYNALYEALAFQGSTRYRSEVVRRYGSHREALFSLAGPTGDGPDVIMRDVMLAEDVAVGDRLIFYAVGAYSLAVASSFNGFPKPAVYFI